MTASHGQIECHLCKYLWYFAPNGQDFERRPHARCLHFKENILLDVEKVKGCDGTYSNVVTKWHIPENCPTFAQGSLL